MENPRPLNKEEIDLLLEEPSFDKEQTYDILSQEEINSLLEVVDGDEDSDYHKCCFSDKQIILYDFKRPTYLTRKEIKTLKKIHDIFSRQLQYNLKEFLGTNVEIQLHAVDQLTYDEYLYSLSSEKWIYPLSINNELGLSILEIDAPIAKFLTMKMLNPNNYEVDNSTRELSSIENDLIIHCVEKCFYSCYEKSWDEYFNFKPKILMPNNETHFIYDILNQNHPVAHIVIEIIIGNCSGMINIAYPIHFNDALISTLGDNNVIK